MVHQIDEHVHGSLPYFLEIDVEGSDGWTEDISVFGADKGANFDIVWNGEAIVFGRVDDGCGDGVTMADEEAFAVLWVFEVFLEVIVIPGVRIRAIDDAIFLA